MVSRRHPDRLLPTVALPLPPGGVPVPGPPGHQPGPQPPGTGVRAGRHRGLRRRPLLGGRGGVGQGGARGPPVADHGAQRRARPGDDRRAADDVVPEPVVLGRGHQKTDHHRVRRRPRHRDPGRGSTPPGKKDPRCRVTRRGAPRGPLLRQREQCGGTVANHREPPFSQRWHRRPRDPRRSHGEPGPGRNQGGAALPPHRGRRGIGGAAAALRSRTGRRLRSRGRRRPRRARRPRRLGGLGLGAASRPRSTPAGPRPTSSTPPWHPTTPPTTRRR